MQALKSLHLPIPIQHSQEERLLVSEGVVEALAADFHGGEKGREGSSLKALSPE